MIPEIVLHEMRKSTSNAECFMGLFGAIGRAWLTVGNCLYLWSFEGSVGRDFTCYTKCSYEIIDVALVAPIPGVFVDSIKWVLVLSTPVEIVLLAVEIGVAGDLILHETDLRFPTDEVNMLAVTGASKTGRIFASGSDGNIYELAYQAESDGWLLGVGGGGKKCRKINRTSTPLSLFLPTFLMSSTGAKGGAIVSLSVDSSRNFLWALGEDSSIRQYWLGGQGKDFQLLAHLSTKSFLQPGKTDEIVAIFPVETLESLFINLVAVGRSGQRYYFGSESVPTANTISTIDHSIPAPPATQLLHIRSPPEENRVRDQRKLIHRWSPTIHAAFYRAGVCLTACKQSAEEDALLGMILNPSSGSLNARIRLPLEYSIEQPLDGKVWAITEVTISGSERRCFAVLTNVGVYLYTQMRPIDQLAALLSSSHSLPIAQLEKFFDAFGPERACALCISLCIDASSGNSVVYANALTVLLKLGGMPRLLSDAQTQQPQHVSIGRIISTQPEFVNSPLHDGLYVSFSQAVAPLWKKSIWQDVSMEQSDHSSISSTKTSLYQLLKFMNENMTHFTENRLSGVTEERLMCAIQGENESINALKDAATLSMEILAFLSIASDYRLLPMLIKEPISREFSDACLEMLSTQPRGRALLTELGGILVQRQLKLKIPTRPLCEALRARCPSLFSSEDISLQEAMECLERASATKSMTERAEWITEAMNGLLSSAAGLSLPTLLSIFNGLDRLHFQDCTLRLGLAYCEAKQLSSQDSLHLVHDRMMESLASCGFIQERTVSSQLGIDEMRNRWLSMAVNSQNEGFLMALYGWLLTNRFIGTLLDLPSVASLQSFLLTDFPCAELPRRDLLWKWLVKRERFAEAAGVLYQLAACVQLPLCLSERIEYLSLAMTNNSSSPGGQASLMTVDSIAAFLKPLLVSNSILEEALEVSALQMEVLQEAKQVATPEGMLADLDGGTGLLGVTELFNDYARPLKLTEASLKLLHTSGLIAEVLVAQLWIEWKGANLRLEANSLQVRLRLISLVRRLYPSPAALPLLFVIDVLGRELYALGWGAEWLPGVLLEAGIPVSLLSGELVKLLTGASAAGSKAWLNGELATFGLSMAAVVFAVGISNNLRQIDPERIEKCCLIAQQLGESQLIVEFGILLRELALKK